MASTGDTVPGGPTARGGPFWRRPLVVLAAVGLAAALVLVALSIADTGDASRRPAGWQQLGSTVGAPYDGTYSCPEPDLKTEVL